MHELADAWGSPGYQLLTAACQRAGEHHQAYERSGHLPSLQQAIDLFRAVHQAAHNVDIRSAAANGLGIALWSQYERSSRPEDLDASIGLFHEALEMYPDEETATLPTFRANLAGTLQLRWRRTRRIDDLTAAIEAARASLAGTSEGHPQRTGRLTGLANGLLDLYAHHDDSSALAEAIQLFRQAVDLAEAGSDIRTWARSNLAEALRRQCLSADDHEYEHDHDPAVLDEAAALARSALAATPARRLLHPRFQSNLSAILVDRYRARGRRSDLAEAAALARRAVAATPADHPNRAERLCILADIAYMDVMRRSGRSRTPLAWSRRRPHGSGRALDRLIRTTGKALAAVPDGHVLRAAALMRQGSALALKATARNDAALSAASVACFQEVAADPGAPVSARITAARLWAFGVLGGFPAGDMAGSWAAAMEPFTLAVNLLPRAAPRRITRGDRERQLADFAGLARDAAACAIELLRPDLAVQLLEQGRGVLLGQALDSRTELTDLYERHPELAAGFEELRTALDRPEDTDFTSALETIADKPPAAPPLREDRHALAEKWEHLLDAIRGQPGFGHFLRPPQVADLLADSSCHGPVVIVNVSGLRCDALLLEDRRVHVIPLPALDHAELLRRTDDFLLAVRGAMDAGRPVESQRAAQRAVRETLEWLWTAVCEPVLNSLGPTGQPLDGAPPRRLWWVPTGPLTALPLHAAGRHDSPGSNVLDRVISSYAPTVRSLTHAWKHYERTDAERGVPPTPLIVALPSTPDATDLPWVSAETSMLTSRLPASKVLTGDRALRQTVLDELPGHRWAHFACHAASPARGVSSGHLVLHDHAVRKLTASDISRLRLDNAELAYLSACETSLARKDLADEAVHITGAFHMAGFCHVVGTLWVADDEIASRVAGHFYRALTAAEPSALHAARALHDAVHTVRADYPATPTLWGPYLHVGA